MLSYLQCLLERGTRTKWPPVFMYSYYSTGTVYFPHLSQSWKFWYETETQFKHWTDRDTNCHNLTNRGQGWNIKTFHHNLVNWKSTKMCLIKHILWISCNFDEIAYVLKNPTGPKLQFRTRKHEQNVLYYSIIQSKYYKEPSGLITVRPCKSFWIT